MIHSARKDLKTYRLNLFLRFEFLHLWTPFYWMVVFSI